MFHFLTKHAMPITIPNVILFLALAKLVTQGLKTDHTE